MNIFVARLASQVTSDDLRALFESYGEVDSAKVIMDRETGNSRGFGFVEMSADDEAKQAIQALDGSDYQGRRIVVKQAEEREKSGGGQQRYQQRPRMDRGGYRNDRNDRNDRGDWNDRGGRRRDNRDNRDY